MTMSIYMKRAEQEANRLDDGLRADDPRFCQSTLIVSEDGSVFFTDSSFLVEWTDLEYGDGGADEFPGQWVFVLAEHHPARVFAKSDLLHYRQLGERTG